MLFSIDLIMFDRSEANKTRSFSEFNGKVFSEVFSLLQKIAEEEELEPIVDCINGDSLRSYAIAYLCIGIDTGLEDDWNLYGKRAEELDLTMPIIQQSTITSVMIG